MADVTKLEAKRAIYIPAGASKITSKVDNSIAYRYTNKAGKPCAMAFRGNRQKPSFMFFYDNEKTRNEKIAGFFQDVFDAKQRKVAAHALAKAPHTVKVGDIFYTSWGYDQTNVDFFEVVGLVGKATVELRKLKSVTVGGGGDMSDYVVASQSGTGGGVFRKRVNMAGGTPSVKISDCETGWVWDGKPKYCSWYH